jgi:hypothetical protein
MSEKHFEEDRKFFKSFLKSFFRSFFQTRVRTRSQTRSMIESESESESTSFSMTESDITERDLARSIRNQSVDDVLINQYVTRMFETFFQNNIQDHELWKTIYYAFENFKLEHWNMFIISNWDVIKKICYTQRFWIDKSSRNVSRDKLMLQTTKDDYYENWTMNQIKYVERHYRSISSATRNRKNELLKICDQSSIQSSHSSSSSIFITFLHSSTSTSRHYDVQSNRQHDFEYAHENHSSMNHARKIRQLDDRQAFESYVSSSSKISYEKELSTLNKLYKEKEKFENTENNFDFKLTIYLDWCKHADLSKHTYDKEISVMLIDEKLIRYYVNRANFITFNDFCISMRTYFENFEWQNHNLDKWHSIIFENVITVNSNISLTECLRKMCSQMNIIQRDLNSAYHDSTRLRENIIRVCKDHSVLIFALINSSMNTFTLMSILQSSIINYEIVRKFFAHQQYHQNENDIDDHYFIDRQYRRSEYDRRDESSSDRRVEFYRDERDRSNDKFQNRRLKKCFVCDKFDCWSINHSDKKRENSKKSFSDRFSQFRNNNRMTQYICEYESTDENDDHDEMIQYFEEFSINIISASAITSAIILTISSTNIINALLIEFESNELFLISFDELQNIEFEITTSLLSNQAFKHRFISKDCIIIITLINESFDFSFISITDSRYDDHEFKSILMNCEAADLSTDDIEQFKTLKRISNNDVKLNTQTVESNIKFEIDCISILSTVALNISLELIIFHIVEVNTSFLLSLINLNRLKMYFNNLINEMIQKIFDQTVKNQNVTNFQIDSKIRRHSVIRRYDHAFLLWKIFTYSLIIEFIDENSCLLIEIELRRLHRRFDHLSARRLYEILTRSDHDNVESRVIEHLNKYCHHCQLHEKSFERFSFSIKNDAEFNFNILMNILYIEAKSDENKLVLHLMNEAIRFQVDRWLRDISARHVWD